MFKHHTVSGLLLVISFLPRAGISQAYAESVYEHLYQKTPTDTYRLLHGTTLDGFFGDYLAGSKHRAFAQSDGGAWAFVTQRSSSEQAMADALTKCREFNALHYRTAPCKIQHVDNSWQEDSDNLMSVLRSVPEWQPDNEEVGRDILSSIEQDVREHQYPQALAKQLWYYHHILAHGGYAAATPRSAVLNSWKVLGNAYPPAKVLLNGLSFNLLARIKAKHYDAGEELRELVAINRVLNRNNRSVELFLSLQKQDEQHAKQVFDVFTNALLNRRQYALYARYIEPYEAYKTAYTRYQTAVVNAGTYGADHPQSLAINQQAAVEAFAYDVGNLIAALWVIDRKTQARTIADRASRDVVLEPLPDIIRAALEGKFPRQ